MELIESLYLHRTPYTHTVDCPNPSWDVVDVLRDTGVRPVPTGAEPCSCPNDVCGHDTTFPRVRLRLLCRDCGTVYTITGESLTEVPSHTSLTGWGQPPRQVGDVWLWPGQPAIPGGEPGDYLVTRQPAAVTQATLYGIITSYREASHARRWRAAVLPDTDGPHQVHSLRWRHTRGGLPTVDAAAAWISGAELAAVQPLVVAV
ncbi:hypothetical protein [Streptomyces sp. NPDC002692]